MKNKDYKFVGKSVYIPEKKILVITDLHIGYEETLKSQGVFLPKTQFKETKEQLEKILRGVEVKKVVILGDLKHEFGKISRQEWKETKKLIDFFRSRVEKIILLKGNHDTILEPIAREKGLEIKKYWIHKKTAFIHGDKQYVDVLDKKIKRIFMGHLHPAITIKKGVKRETYKCFLVGKYKNKEIIILPSFFPLVEGSDVIIEDTNLDFDFSLKDFKVFVPSDKEVLEFGKVKDVGRLVG